MGRISKINKEDRIKACKQYEQGKGSFDSIGFSLGVSKYAVRNWYYKYERHGQLVFNNKKKNRTYTKEFKMSIINDYLSGGGSSTDLAVKYDIASSMVCRWINKYNDGIEVTDYNPKSEVYTMKKRKTTFEERVEIVKWVIENSMNYKECSSKFSIPYSSVYSWTHKYLNNGEDSLKHNKRGRKTENKVDLDSLNEVEKLKLLLAEETKKRKYAELSLEVYKKKEEITKKLYQK
ncbi:helix-turn-helix domain-containing protein [Mycoplasmatota bacterium WC44]